MICLRRKLSNRLSYSVISATTGLSSAVPSAFRRSRKSSSRSTRLAIWRWNSLTEGSSAVRLFRLSKSTPRSRTGKAPADRRGGLPSAAPVSPQKSKNTKNMLHRIAQFSKRFISVSGLITRLNTRFCTRSPGPLSALGIHRDLTAPCRSGRRIYGEANQACQDFSRMAGQHDLHHRVRHQRERQGDGIREDKAADYERTDNFGKESLLRLKNT